jgi:hypothetical protein
MSKMTAAEREALCKLVRDNARVAKADADARGKWLLAQIEAQLAECYRRDDSAWADAVAAAEKAIEEANAVIAAAFHERGIRKEFRPAMVDLWFERGETAMKDRRAELRKAAQSQVAARVAEAKVEIDRQAVAQQMQITQAALSSAEAQAFLAAMPSPEELLPPVGSLELRSGEIVALDAVVTPDGAPVTAAGVTAVTAVARPETDNPNRRCAYCGIELSPGRSDARFCGPAHRVAQHRKLRAAAGLSQRNRGDADSVG